VGVNIKVEESDLILLPPGERRYFSTQIEERMVCYGKTNSMGDFSHGGEGKGEKRKEISPNGLL
jgi:hypothetical protein